MSSDDTKGEIMNDDNLFIMYKGLTLNNNILKTNEYGGWVHYGFKTPIMDSKTVTLSIKPLKSRENLDQIMHVCPGFSTPGVMNTFGFSHLGGYVNGLSWYMDGNIYCNDNYVAFIGRYALKQECTMKIINRKEIEFYVDGIPCKKKSIKFSELNDINPNATLYPGISMAGPSSEVEIIKCSVDHI